MKVYLRLGSLFFLFAFFSCANPYKHLQQSKSASPSAMMFKPQYDKVLYRCVVNGRVAFKKFHLSGLLFFKQLPDSTTRAVFQNEMGFNFFDFEWSKTDSFQVNKIIDQLNKPALIKVLEKDMNLLLMKNIHPETETVFKQNGQTYYRFSLDKGVAYYIAKDKTLSSIENAGKTKVITISMGEKRQKNDMPISVLFNHHKANFRIQLTKIDTDVDE